MFFFITKLSWKWQILLHLSVITTIIIITTTPLLGRPWALTSIPGILGDLDTFGSNEVLRILKVGLLSVGAAFLLLSTVSTSLQTLAVKIGVSNPYSFYRASNLGSLIGLFSFPLLIEPTLPARTLLPFWTGAVILLFSGIGLVYLFLYRRTISHPHKETPSESSQLPTLRQCAIWSALAVYPVAISLAVTNQITLGLAPIPYLWILPFGAYLVGFIAAFGLYKTESLALFILYASGLVGLITMVRNAAAIDNYIMQLLALTLIVFFSSLIFHTRAYELRPHKSSLSYFYLNLAFGGMLGGLLITLAAPLIFKTYFELELLLVIGIAFTIFLYTKHSPLRIPIGNSYKTVRAKLLIGIALVLLAAFVKVKYLTPNPNKTIYQARNFYGILAVKESSQDRTMVNGDVVHGSQLLSDTSLPTLYYGQSSGATQTVKYFQAARQNQGIKIGIIGLGTGSIAVYCQPGDRFIFYEINDQVTEAARQYFSYLRNCPGSSVISGDARTKMAKEPPLPDSEKYDVVMIDAFTDDAIPTHLITEEAGRLYLSKIKSDGAVLYHVSNKFLQLTRVLKGFADDEGLLMKDLKATRSQVLPRETVSEWVLLTKNASAAATIAGKYPNPDGSFRPVKWTDDYSNLLQVIKLR